MNIRKTLIDPIHKATVLTLIGLHDGKTRINVHKDDYVYNNRS